MNTSQVQIVHSTIAAAWSRITNGGRVCFHFLSVIAAFAICASVFAAESNSEKVAGRAAKGEEDLSYWLANMAAHRFTTEEVASALNLSASEVSTVLKQRLATSQRPAELFPNPAEGEIVILPYPGGRHPRIGFLEGAIQPQRETKISVFAPWKDGGYIVIDLPEAVWHQREGKRELLYLAHTHVPTIWNRQNVELDQLEWDRSQQKALTLSRPLPNKITMTSRAHVAKGGLRMEFSITNGTAEILSGLQIQMCGMLKGLVGFTEQTNDNKVFSSPFAMCKNRDGNRWVILGFDHCHRAWGNAKCPCLHADPQVPDCRPAETQTVHGWISFFEGPEIAPELKRLEKIAFESSEHP